MAEALSLTVMIPEGVPFVRRDGAEDRAHVVADTLAKFGIAVTVTPVPQGIHLRYSPSPYDRFDPGMVVDYGRYIQGDGTEFQYPRAYSTAIPLGSTAAWSAAPAEVLASLE